MSQWNWRVNASAWAILENTTLVVLVLCIREQSLTARFMGPTWDPGPTGPRWAPFWPHEVCYLGSLITLSNTPTSWFSNMFAHYITVCYVSISIYIYKPSIIQRKYFFFWRQDSIPSLTDLILLRAYWLLMSCGKFNSDVLFISIVRVRQ